MRRRLRRRPAPRKALTPKSTKRKAPGSDDSGALRLALFSALKAVIVLVPTGHPLSAPLPERAGAPSGSDIRVPSRVLSAAKQGESGAPERVGSPVGA